MLGVTVRDLVETAIIAGGTLLVVLLKRRDLLLYCFDPNHARAIGLPVRVLHYGLLILLSLTIVGSLKAVGIILVIAMLVAPGAIAYLLTDSFERMLVIATAVAIASCALGTIVSFHIDGATGACIVLIQFAVFVLAFLFAPKRGLRLRMARGARAQRRVRPAAANRRADASASRTASSRPASAAPAAGSGPCSPSCANPRTQ